MYIFLNILKFAGVCLSAYLIGAFPSALVLAKLFKGVNLLKEGSGNPGLSNALDVCGVWPVGFFAIITEFTKAWWCYVFAWHVCGWNFSPGLSLQSGGVWGMMLLAFFAFLGHDFSVFLKFRGGKGTCIPASTLLFFGAFYYVVSLIWIFVPYMLKDKKKRFKIQNSLMILLILAGALLLLLEKYFWAGTLFAWRFSYLFGIHPPDLIPIAAGITALTLLFPVRRCIMTGVAADIKKGIPPGKALYLRALFMMYPKESDSRPPGKNFDMVED